MHDLKARRKQLQDDLHAYNEESSAALAEARDTGKGLTGDILARFDRADAGADRSKTELDAINGKITEARNEGTIVDAGSSTKTRTGSRLGPDQRFADIVGDRTDRSEELGVFLRDIISSRAQSEGVNADGGYTVPDILSANLWDLARDRTVAAESGVSFLAIDSGPGDTFHLAKVTEDAQPAWVGEGTQFPEDQISLSSAVLKPKKIALTVKATHELLQDSNQDFAQVIAQTVAASIARELDRVIFNGAGGAEPLGIRNTPGIAQVPGVGAPDWATLSNSALAIEQANYSPSGFVMAPRTAHALANQREDGTTGAYLAPPSTVAGIPRLSTNMVATDLGAGTDESYILGGDFSQAVFGTRLGLSVQPLDQRWADQGQMGWIFYTRCDLAVMRTEAFQSLEGVTA